MAQFLQADDFYIHRHRWIWEAFTGLHEQRIPIDLLTLTEELERKGQLEEIGGRSFLTTLVNQVPSSLNAAAYAHIVEGHAIRRRMITAANSIASVAYNEDLQINDVMDEAEKAVFNVSERRLRHDVQPIRDVLRDYYDRIDAAARTGRRDPRRSNRLPGPRQAPARTAAFGSPYHRGSSRAGQDRLPAFGGEERGPDPQETRGRILPGDVELTGGGAPHIPADRHRLPESPNGAPGRTGFGLLAEAVEKLSETQIFLDDTPAITPIQLRTKCRRLHLEHRLDLVIVDYLQLMTGDTRTDNRVQEVAYISRNLKVLACELNVPVLAAAQLSRAIEQRADKEPQLSDLRELGSLEQDFDIVMFLYRPEGMGGRPCQEESGQAACGQA